MNNVTINRISRRKAQMTLEIPIDETPIIQVTKNYAQFKLMKGNRAIDYNHVKRLKRSMETDPHLFQSNPIQANEHMFIIDGQHRWRAAQELNVPLYYIMTPGITLTDTRVLNVTQRKWQLLDFARSYASSGHQDYVSFLRLNSKYPQIAPGILRTYLAGGQKHDLEISFRNGEFVIHDLALAEKNIEHLAAIIDKTHTRVNAPMAYGLWQLFKSEKVFDFDLFMQKLDRENARALFQPFPSSRQCLRAIEEIYNYQSKVQKRLY